MFLQRFSHCFLLRIFSLPDSFFFFIAFFLNRQSFSTNQLTEHSSRQSGDYLPSLILVINILLRSNTVFIIPRYGLHGQLASYIYGSCYLLQQCGFIKLRFKIGKANFMLNDGRYYVSQKFDHILKILFWMF